MLLGISVLRIKIKSEVLRLLLKLEGFQFVFFFLGLCKTKDFFYFFIEVVLMLITPFILVGKKKIRLHYTWIDIGTPNVSFLVALDAGSDLLWVPCDCIQCAPLSASYYDSLVNLTVSTLPLLLNLLHIDFYLSYLVI